MTELTERQRLPVLLAVLVAHLGCGGPQEPRTQSYEVAMQLLCDSPTLSQANEAPAAERPQTIAYWIGSNIHNERLTTLVDGLSELRPGELDRALATAAGNVGIAQCALASEGGDWVWLPRHRGPSYTDESIVMSDIAWKPAPPRQSRKKPKPELPVCEFDRLVTWTNQTAVRTVRRCHKIELERDSKFEGRVKVEMSVGPTGQVLEANVQAPNELMTSCVETAAKNWNLGVSDNGDCEPVRVSFTAVLYAE